MSNLFKKAFTLIELLVVIAIIGILSGLIVITMGGATQKASIAKAQVFSNSLRNSLMLDLVAEYKLDGDGNDSWGSHDGTITGTTTSSSDCIYGSCLSLNGSTYISIPDDAVFNFGTQMTTMVWVKGVAQATKTVICNWENVVANKAAWWMGTQTASPNNKLRVVISDDGSFVAGHRKEYYTTTTIAFDNTWHLIGLTWNSGVLKLYIDGVDSAVTKVYDDAITSINNTDVNLTIAALLNSGSPANYFTGLIDEARLYDSAIPTSQIQEQYYAGLNKLLINGGITREEYLSRVLDLNNSYGKK
jgi:prepilin-type N-terminal cleavage/methylation domain-containing protein